MDNIIKINRHILRWSVKTIGLTSSQISSLERAGLKKDQINIVVHNLDKLVSSNKITDRDIQTAVDKLANDNNFQRTFFTNPLIALDKLFNI